MLIPFFYTFICSVFLHLTPRIPRITTYAKNCAFFLYFIIVQTLWKIWKECFQFHRNICKIGSVSKKYTVLLIYGQLWFNLRGTEAQSELTPNVIQMERSGKGWSLCTSADINERSEKGLPQDRGFMYGSKTTLIPNAFDLYYFLWRTKDRNSRYFQLLFSCYGKIFVEMKA